MKFCFSILHYRTESDTIACVESIKKYCKDSEIVIVDNYSNNGSIEKVEEYCKSFERVHILKCKENLGFAAGNNVGYRFAKHNLNCDFIAIQNNDTIIGSEDFVEKIIKIYHDKKFHVLGPDIMSLVDGGHQNPAKNTLSSKKEVKKQIIVYSLLFFLSRVGIYDLLKKNKSTKTGSTRKEIPNSIIENVTLHGSFVVFSPIFLEREECSFGEGTFLYCEEAILKKYCDKMNYKMIFFPDVVVFHREDSSTNSLSQSNKAKREFVFKNMIKSLKVYQEYL